MQSQISKRTTTALILQTVSLICVAAILFCTLALVATIVLVPVGVFLGVGIPVSVMFLIGNPIPPSQIPTIQTYMPLWMVELRLYADFPLEMSQEDVENRIKQTEWLYLIAVRDSEPTYLDVDGKVTYSKEQACSEFGVTSITVFVGEAPFTTCKAHFAFNENGELTKIQAERVWSLV